ncbi:hypothetical protein FRC10_003541 [Ceratobasidium sp. 414]|nr:hypothetical protein FRC10_003541 [Ceratobasidium sp. 414]
MDDIDLPDDPLLQLALEQSNHGAFMPPDEGGNPNHDSDNKHTGHDASGANKRPWIDGDLDVSGTHAGQNILVTSTSGPQTNQQSLRQYIQGLVALKKLNNNSVQELHQFSTASGLECEMMGFALSLEIRDTLGSVAAAVVSSGIHPNLVMSKRKEGVAKMDIGSFTAHVMRNVRIKCWNAATNSEVNSTWHELGLNASYWCPMFHGDVHVTVETVTRVSYAICPVLVWSPLYGVDTDMLPSYEEAMDLL